MARRIVSDDEITAALGETMSRPRPMTCHCAKGNTGKGILIEEIECLVHGADSCPRCGAKARLVGFHRRCDGCGNHLVCCSCQSSKEKPLPKT